MNIRRTKCFSHRWINMPSFRAAPRSWRKIDSHIVINFCFRKLRLRRFFIVGHHFLPWEISQCFVAAERAPCTMSGDSTGAGSLASPELRQPPRVRAVLAKCRIAQTSSPSLSARLRLFWISIPLQIGFASNSSGDGNIVGSASAIDLTIASA